MFFASPVTLAARASFGRLLIVRINIKARIQTTVTLVRAFESSSDEFRVRSGISGGDQSSSGNFPNRVFSIDGASDSVPPERASTRCASAGANLINELNCSGLSHALSPVPCHRPCPLSPVTCPLSPTLNHRFSIIPSRVNLRSISAV